MVTCCGQKMGAATRYSAAVWTAAELEFRPHIKIDVANSYPIRAISAGPSEMRTGGSLSFSHGMGKK